MSLSDPSAHLTIGTLFYPIIYTKPFTNDKHKTYLELSTGTYCVYAIHNLQEIIQNADDAGATKVQFFIDHRKKRKHYKNLENSKLEDYQGPALISANDSSFSAEDWEGIQKLQQSIKADDPLKVGQFGIGFNSVYHITGI